MYWRKIYSLLLTFLLTSALFFFSAFLPLGDLARAEEAIDRFSIPTIAYANGQQELLAPDWSQITFSSLPPLEESGWIEVPSNLVAKIGYDPNRIWQAGATVDRVLKLGDIASAFRPERFKLQDISDLSGLAIESLNLNDFGLLNWQTTESLVRAIPELGKLSISQVELFRDLLSEVRGGVWDEKIASIAADRVLGKLPLGEFLDLSQYSLNSIPGLSKIPLNKFKAWSQSFIAQVPGLAQIPLTQMPIPIPIGIGIAAIHDLTLTKEHGDPFANASLTISGSVNRKGYIEPVPCSVDRPCAYVELSDFVGAKGAMYGKRWVSGKVQKVKGGFGPMRALNGGWEPTGVLPYGTAFKVVLLAMNESKGTANYGLYFRSCVNIPFYGKSCSPYFIGPVPWLPTKEKGLVIVASASRPPVNIPSKYQNKIDAIRQQYEPENTVATLDGSSALCGQGLGGVDYADLAKAFSSIEGNYNSVGAYTNGGRGLGRYQYMSYRQDVRAIIAAKPGGIAFLALANSGTPISQTQVNQFFPPADQDRLFRQDQERNIQQAMREGFSGSRLIERVGQIHYGGPGAPIDGNSADLHGRLTLYTYGQQLARNYQQASSRTSSSCSVISGSGNGRTQGKLTNPAPKGAIMTSDFGPRSRPCDGCSNFHQGVDIAIANGTNVKASDGGTVVYNGAAQGYGNVLIIDHGNGLQTRYAHLEGFVVQKGALVTSGQVVAKSDSTGVGTGAHLHFEVRENSSRSKDPFDPSINAVDPEKYLKFD